MSQSSNFYLHLFHGRSSPDERLSDWSIDGPWIGPLLRVQTTYARTIKLTFVDPQDVAKFGLDLNQPWLHVRDMMLVHDQIFFGEWEIYSGSITTPEPVLPTTGDLSELDTHLMSVFDSVYELADA